MTRIWCNGEWLDAADFPGSVMDRGALLGLGLFETLLAVDGVPMFAPRHLARFQRGCERLGWDYALPDFQETAGKLLELNHLTKGRAKIRLTLTAGSGPLDDLSPGGDRVLWMTALPVRDVPGELAACLSPWRRNDKSPLAGLKCASYAENLYALNDARRRGFQETLFLNTADHLCEAATANLFLAKKGMLLTPSLDSGCLPGITREVVLELAGSLGIPCEETELGMGDLDAAEEIFLTSAIRGVTGVSRLDSRRFTIGLKTQLLREALRGRMVLQKLG